MKAIVVDPRSRNLSWETVPDPQPGPDEVLVDIHATAVNRADLLQRSGKYPPPPGAPEYLGLEMAGVVSEAGDGSDWKPGDRVCALLSGGGYAEQVAVPQGLLHRMPDNWDFTYGAAVPEVFYTAFVNLFFEAGLQPGETVLIHGGASGVGTAAIQLAKQSGCRVLATAGSDRKLECCRRLGAELAVNYKEEDFAASVLAHCEGVDVILDIAGASSLAGNVEVLKLKGRLVVISVLGGTEGSLDIGAVLRKRLRIAGSLLRSRSLDEKAAIKEKLEECLWGRIEDGRIEAVIDSVLPVAEAAEAHRRLAENRNIGKVVLAVREQIP